jgi:hypothetical protein
MDWMSFVMISRYQYFGPRAIRQPLEGTLVRVHGDVTEHEHEVILADAAVPVVCQVSLVLVVIYNPVYAAKAALTYNEVVPDVSRS